MHELPIRLALNVTLHLRDEQTKRQKRQECLRQLSGAEMNLKVGGHRSGTKVARHVSGAKHREKLFGRASPPLASKVQLVVLVSAFVMVSTVRSVHVSRVFC